MFSKLVVGPGSVGLCHNWFDNVYWGRAFRIVYFSLNSLQSPEHQRTWYWLCRTNYMGYHFTVNLIHFGQPNPRYVSKCQYIFCSLWKWFSMSRVKDILNVLISVSVIMTNSGNEGKKEFCWVTPPLLAIHMLSQDNTLFLKPSEMLSTSFTPEQ